MALLCFIFFSLCFLDNGGDLNENYCEGIYWFRSKARAGGMTLDLERDCAIKKLTETKMKKNGTKSSLSK